jgi:hypothetical protein
MTDNVIQFPTQRRQAQILTDGLNALVAAKLAQPAAASTRKTAAMPKAKPIRVRPTKADMSGLPAAPLAQGRIEKGEREIFDRVTAMKVGKSSKDLAKASGELAIETFGGKVENVIFTPHDGALDDAEILPKSIVRDGSTIEIRSERSHWVFVVEAAL